jgi:hypothetical protein
MAPPGTRRPGRTGWGVFAPPERNFLGNVPSVHQGQVVSVVWWQLTQSQDLIGFSPETIVFGCLYYQFVTTTNVVDLVKAQITLVL